MKILTAYFSHTGNTQALAKAIQQAVGGDIEDIRVSGLPFGWRKNSLRLESIQHPPHAYDLVILGTPVWAFNMAPAIRAYLTEEVAKTPVNVAFFCTEALWGHKRTFREMETVSGKTPLATLAVKAREMKKQGAVAFAQTFAKKLHIENTL